ncbi:hypothetical protein RintRC_6452 [Richelia intracellularis]|nr:hypothetical protein RintRC_6452 [Richelia intracellularis]
MRTLSIIFFLLCSQWMIAVDSFMNVTEELGVAESGDDFTKFSTISK